MIYLKKLMADGESYWPISVDETDVDGVQSLRDQGYVDATQEEFEARDEKAVEEGAGATGTDMEEGQGNAEDSIQPLESESVEETA